MPGLRYLIVFLLLLFANTALAKERVQVRIPTAAEETELVWRTIKDISFFERNKYQLALPDGPFMDTLLQKARAGHLEAADKAALGQYIETRVYKREDYLKGLAKVEAAKGKIGRLITKLGPQVYPGFKTFDVYTVRLTLYGPGGTYDDKTGGVMLYTTTAGAFKGYDEPAPVILHEIVHIGIHQSIVRRCDVPHALKERIVDRFVWLLFGTDLPEYMIQDMGETRIDAYLQQLSDLRNLDAYVVEILGKG